MKLSGWRILQSTRAQTAFDGEGARLYGGRWNHKGTPLVYTASSQSLAALELLVHLPTPEILERYVTISVEFDDALCRQIDPGDLPRNWRSNPPLMTTKDFGTAWVNSAASAVLMVPSAIIPSEYNFLLNPRHPEFGKIVIGRAHPFKFDARLAKE